MTCLYFLPGFLTSQAEGKLATMALLLLLLNQGWIHCWQTCSESRVKNKVLYCQHDPGPGAYQKTYVSYILKGTGSASAASGLKHQNLGPKSMSFVFTQPHSLPATACCDCMLLVDWNSSRDSFVSPAGPEQNQSLPRQLTQN